MPSKGIQFYAYAAGDFSIEIGHKDAGDSRWVYKAFENTDGWEKEKFEVETNWFYTEGKVWIAVKRGSTVLKEITLPVDGFSGTSIELKELGQFTESPILGDDFMLSFGIFDADNVTFTGMPNKHQIYVSITPKMDAWQSDIIAAHGDPANLFPKNFFLPGSHDAGMYMSMVPEIGNLANTQNSNIQTQLQLGSRYFDFRPGLLDPAGARKFISDQGDKYLKKYLPFPFDKFISFTKETLMPAIEGVFRVLAKPELQHIHAIIPGETYTNFLEQIFSFLSDPAHRSEFVCLEICSNGIIRDAARPASSQELLHGLKAASEKYGVNFGGKECLEQSIESLIENNIRVIALDAINNSFSMKGSYSSKFETSDGFGLPAQEIENVLNKLSAKEVKDKDYLYLSCQLSANGTGGGIYQGIKCGNKFGSPLLATKPATDQKTFEFLLANKLKYHNNETIMLAGNDFYTNAFSHVASKVNRMKLGLPDQ